MKNKTLLIAMILLVFSACNEEHFANKVIKDIGNGVYASPLCVGRSIDKTDLLIHDDVFSLAEIYNKAANERSEIKDYEIYFQTNVMFDKFALIESKHSVRELLSLNIRHVSSDKDMYKYFDDVREDARLNDKNYFSLDEISYVSTAYSSVDEYFMKYKISTRQEDKIAYLTIMKIPNKGYRVTSFIII